MPKPKVKFIVKNFRAVANAEIALDGISVLTGENGCGKSSISKLVYYSIYYSKGYKKLVYDFFRSKKDKVYSALESLYQELKTDEDEGIVIDLTTGNWNEIRIDDYLEELSKKSYSNRYTAREKGVLYETVLNGLINLESDTRKIIGLEPNQHDTDNIQEKPVSGVFELLKEINKNVNENIEKILANKPAFLLFNKLGYIFRTEIRPENIELTEFKGKLFNNAQKRILSLHSISKLSYIDTPMSLGQYEHFYLGTENEHWSHLNNTLRNDSNNCLSISNIDENVEDILNGNITYEYDRKGDDFTYKRKDGKVINLLNCATGLKSFAMLQLLFQQNYLNNETLLIIDEPEAHLHPQWIVEYARLIVLLHKRLGVKFLIASHHPQMISSIKYIAEKEGIDKKVNFYLGERATEFTYNFKNYHTDIEPIFASFNIAFDKMDQYAAATE